MQRRNRINHTNIISKIRYVTIFDDQLCLDNLTSCKAVLWSRNSIIVVLKKIKVWFSLKPPRRSKKSIDLINVCDLPYDRSQNVSSSMNWENPERTKSKNTKTAEIRSALFWLTSVSSIQKSLYWGSMKGPTSVTPLNPDCWQAAVLKMTERKALSLHFYI